MRVIVGSVLLVALLLGSACRLKPTASVQAGLDACGECNMVIDTPKQACGLFADDRFLPFDSSGCMLRALETRHREGRAEPKQAVCADYVDGSFHDVGGGSFLLTDRIPTVMNAGALFFAQRAQAEAHKSSPGESITDWSGYRAQRGTPQRTVKITVGKDGMSPELITLRKGELVALELVASSGPTPMRVAIRGYEQLGEIELLDNGQPTRTRLLATHPGNAFPVVRLDNGETVGRVRVEGAHTREETQR